MKHLKNIEQEFWSKAGRTLSVAKQPLVPVYRVGEVFRNGRVRWPEEDSLPIALGGLS